MTQRKNPMEKSADELGEILQQGLSIRLPNLEDAGLEDCALPPNPIMEAFARAAISLKFCVQDLGPTNGEIPDALPGVGDGGGAPACGCGVISWRAVEGWKGTTMWWLLAAERFGRIGFWCWVEMRRERGELAAMEMATTTLEKRKGVLMMMVVVITMTSMYLLKV